MGGKIIPSDKRLLEVYMIGFDDELKHPKRKDRRYRNYYFISAYLLGKSHAIIGDDVSSIDEWTNDMILKEIKDIRFINRIKNNDL